MFVIVPTSSHHVKNNMYSGNLGEVTTCRTCSTRHRIDSIKNLAPPVHTQYRAGSSLVEPDLCVGPFSWPLGMLQITMDSIRLKRTVYSLDCATIPYAALSPVSGASSSSNMASSAAAALIIPGDVTGISSPPSLSINAELL